MGMALSTGGDKAKNDVCNLQQRKTKFLCTLGERSIERMLTIRRTRS